MKSETKFRIATEVLINMFLKLSGLKARKSKSTHLAMGNQI